MDTAPRNLPRFLPTLTEVVHPSMVAPRAEPARPEQEQLVGSVMKRVDMMIERRLREEADAILQTMVTEQLQCVIDRLRPELEAVVRQAVAEAVSAQTESYKTK